MRYVICGVLAVCLASPALGQSAVSAIASPPVTPAQSSEPQPLTDPAQPIEQTQPAGAPQPADPALSTQAQPQAPIPVAGQPAIIVTHRKASPDDPLEDLNSKSYQITQKVDDALIAPIAFTYEKIMPRPVRDGLRNFLRNLGEPINFVNFMLQLKPGKAFETVGRFAINTTLGIGGVIDVAKRKPFKLPYRRNGFANTLGYYGVKPGPYLFLPLIGATTLRDLIGGRLDLLFLPVAVGGFFTRPEFGIPAGVLSSLDYRIEFDEELRAIRASKDPYVAKRTYYLRKRQAEIDALHGRKPSAPPVTAPASTPNPAPAPISPAPGQSGSREQKPPNPGLFSGLSSFGTAKLAYSW
jgi:phospholipid-binding lipoprotein MlaA